MRNCPWCGKLVRVIGNGLERHLPKHAAHLRGPKGPQTLCIGGAQ
jgi:hypothetical protein